MKTVYFHEVPVGAVFHMNGLRCKKKSAENGTLRRINSYFRANDTSHQWPVCNKFNATDRAIRRLRGQYPNGGLEYFLALDAEISRIVNGAA